MELDDSNWQLERVLQQMCCEWMALSEFSFKIAAILCPPCFTQMSLLRMRTRTGCGCQNKELVKNQTACV